MEYLTVDVREMYGMVGHGENEGGVNSHCLGEGVVTVMHTH